MSTDTYLVLKKCLCLFTEEQRTRGNGILCSEVFVSPVRETESDCFEKKIVMAILFLEKMVINKFRETSY